MPGVVEKFLRYVEIDTQSDLDLPSCPSTQKQLDLARLLFAELQALGLKGVSLDENGYVMASLPANVEKDVPVVGFLAHVDTSPEMSGANVHPHFVENYDGKDILLDPDKEVALSPENFPDLLKYVGQTLITTDGTTLLGADDKAGVAEIMAAVETLATHPEIKHGAVKVAFTPDEEIGRGPDLFDVKKFGAEFAYTIDGGEIGELQYENFNACRAEVTIQGRGVHPGEAKDKMVSALLIGMELNEMLPVNERPAYTAGYEGFYHLERFEGKVEEAKIVYILRDHDRQKFEAKKSLLQSAAAYLNEKHGAGRVSLKLTDQYYNMKEKILPVWHVIEVAEKALRAAGVEPLVIPIRGGTDGSQLSYKGLPTPNIFAGGHNFHGKYEYIPVASMEKAVEVILNIVRLLAE